MAATEINMVLCPVCGQGRRSGSIRMAKHNITPWVPCPGTGERGELAAEGGHRILGIRFALIDSPTGVRPMWRWVCVCGQNGAFASGEENARGHGSQHVTVMERKRS
jgi:hypothetical protein